MSAISTILQGLNNYSSLNTSELLKNESSLKDLISKYELALVEKQQQISDLEITLSLNKEVIQNLISSIESSSSNSKKKVSKSSRKQDEFYISAMRGLVSENVLLQSKISLITKCDKACEANISSDAATKTTLDDSEELTRSSSDKCEELIKYMSSAQSSNTSATNKMFSIIKHKVHECSNLIKKYEDFLTKLKEEYELDSENVYEIYDLERRSLAFVKGNISLLKFNLKTCKLF